jgi:nitrite reductase/ring-hydroxylating ferredoxin subunit
MSERRRTTPYPVARVDEMPPGTRRIVDAGGRSIGVFNVHGTYYAVRNLCPHQQAPLCEGPVMDTTLPSPPGTYTFGLDGRVLRCPWHGWEFDLATGRSLFDPQGCRVRAYPVSVADAGGLQVERYDVTVEGAVVVVHA